MSKFILSILFSGIVLFSCSEQQTKPIGRYELMQSLTEENMSLQDREDVITDIISENPIFALVLSDTSLSWKDFLPAEFIIQDSTIEFIDTEGISSDKVMYTYKKINDTTASFVLETGDSLDFISQKDYYILKRGKLNMYFSKINE